MEFERGRSQGVFLRRQRFGGFRLAAAGFPERGKNAKGLTGLVTDLGGLEEQGPRVAPEGNAFALETVEGPAARADARVGAVEVDRAAARLGRVDQDARVGAAAHVEALDGVTRVWYPFLPSHPQLELAERQMTAGGSVVTFEVEGGKEAAFRLLNALEVIDISNNLGDSKSLVTHPASTTHRRIGPEVRAAMGITDGIIRISVGLENVDDLIEDVTKALEMASG